MSLHCRGLAGCAAALVVFVAIGGAASHARAQAVPPIGTQSATSPSQTATTATPSSSPTGTEGTTASPAPREPPRSRLVPDLVLTGVSLASLALGPVAIAASNDDLSFGDSVVVSLVGGAGVVCAAGGTVLFIGGLGALAVASILAILSEDVAGTVALIGVAAAGAGAGLFLLSPVVFSAAAEVDGGFGDDSGEIAAVSTVSAVAAGLAAMGMTFLVVDWKPSIPIAIAAIFSVSFLAANVAYGLMRAALFEDEGDPEPAMGMLLPPIPF